jgi:hypothetical protein
MIAPSTLAALRMDYASGASRTVCAERYGLTIDQVRYAVRGIRREAPVAIGKNHGNGKKVSVLLDDEEFADVVRSAKRQGMSFAAWVREAVTWRLEEMGA